MQLDKADVSGLEEVVRQEVWPSENVPALDRAYEVRYSDSWEQGRKGNDLLLGSYQGYPADVVHAFALRR